MTESDIAVLIALANGHDQRHGTDDLKVRAWFSLIKQEAPTMDRDWAIEQINYHYARTTDMLMPAHLVTAWKQRNRYVSSTFTRGGVPMPDWFKEQWLGARKQA